LKSTDAAARIRKPHEHLDDVAERLAVMPSQAERLWVSDAIFGDEGSKILLMLKEGAGGLRKLREEARQMGRVLGGEALSEAERLTRAMHRLKDVSFHSAMQMSTPAFKPMAQTFDWISSTMERVNQISLS